MKKILITLFILLFVRDVFGAINVFTKSIDNRPTYKNAYRWTGKPKDGLLIWAKEVEDRIDGTTSNQSMYLKPGTAPDANEGRFYYDSGANKIKLHTGGGFVNLATASGNSLDGAYDSGSGITVDALPVTLTTDIGSSITALDIDHGGASNNSDAITIAMAGSGDGIQITNEDTDSVAMRLISAGSQTVSMLVIDGSSGNWIGNNDVGMLHLKKDTALTNTGSSMLYITNSATPISSAEGFLARFESTGAAQTNAYAVEIQVPATQPAFYVNGIVKIDGQDNAGAVLLQVVGVGAAGDQDAMTITNSGTGDCLQITPTDVGSGGINMVAKAAGIVPLIIVDGVTGDWDGANDKGMINITHDTALVDAGATLLFIGQTTAVKSNAEGFLARFFSDATKQSGAFAVEIEVTNQQPALKVNNNVTIAGADNSGTLLTITHVGATGDANAMTIVSSGSGDSLLITPTDVDSGGINIVGKALGTVPLIILDSSSNNMYLADEKGQLLIQNDNPYNHAGAAGLVILDSGEPITSAEGFLARFIHTGTARGNSSAVQIEVTTAQPALVMNGILKVTGQNLPLAALVQITGNDAGGNLDTMTINTEGTGDGLQITCDDADSVALNVVAAAAQTTSLIKFDGTTGDWRGAANVGMLHITSDGALADVASSLLYIANTGVPQNDARGTCIRIIDSGNAAGTAGYSVYIKTDDPQMEALFIDEGKVLVNETIQTGAGILFGATTQMMSAKITLSNNDIDILAGTPKELVAAPGSGKIIELVSAMLFLDYGGNNAFTEPSAPDDLAILYDNGTGDEIVTWDTTGFITATADAIEYVISANSGNNTTITAAANVDKNIALKNTGSNYTGNANNDNTMIVHVTYRIITTGL